LQKLDFFLSQVINSVIFIMLVSWLELPWIKPLIEGKIFMSHLSRLFAHKTKTSNSVTGRTFAVDSPWPYMSELA